MSNRLHPFRSASRASPLAAALLLGLAANLPADDWPQWMGPGRDGVWRETGIVGRFGTNGPPVKWRVAVKAGYVGPAVAGGRIFLLDREAGKPPERQKGDRSLPTIPGNERVLCIDAATGKTLWERAYDCPYAIDYPAGPRATPLVDGGRVFTLGAMGDLRCFETADGTPVWSKNLPKEFSTQPPLWGYAAHPLLDGDRLIVPVGGTNSALVAFHKDTGAVIWRTLTAAEIGYAPPVIRELAGRRQVVFWHPDAISGLDPRTGEVFWTQKYPVEGRPQRPEVTIAQPRFDGDRVFLTSFYQGSLLLQVPRVGEEPRVVWNRRSSKQSEMTDGLHTVMSTPVIRDGRLYGICAFGELRCLDLATGDRKWESLDVFGGEGGFFATAFLVEQGGRHWVWNDHGELLLARIAPSGFEVISRAKILEPLESTRGRNVLWCHPAFANRSAYLHNGKELLCLDLAATAPGSPAVGDRAADARGTATATMKRPASFPHRIWAACDFEGQTPDYGWFGRADSNRVSRYPGNRTALAAAERPYRDVSAVMTGINPVPGPRMGKENGLFLRYFLQGATQATFQHFSLTREDNWHIAVDGLTQGRWDELTLNFTRDARRNDGSAEPFGDGERMDDFKVFAGRPHEASGCELLLDDVIFFANDPALPPEPEPFPDRVILLAAFDTGPKEKYWPGDFELSETPPAGALWRAARSVPHPNGGGQFIRVGIAPPRPVGAHTKLRFRYHLTGAAAMTVQIFDATVQDNRHIRLEGLKPGVWTTLYLDFTRDSRRNDGTSDSGFTPGNLVDDLFFLVEGETARTAVLFVDEVVLYDAGPPIANRKSQI